MIVTDITYIGDPQIVLHDGTYYVYSTGGPWGCEGGFFTRKSTDLVHWSDLIKCFDITDHWGYECYWAPEVVYHNGKFVMHFSCREKGSDMFKIGVAVSDSPEGPFIDVHGKPMFDLGYSTIDGSVLRTENGNYFYYSRDCSGNWVNGVKTSQLYCVRMSDDLTEVYGEHKFIMTPEKDFETKTLHYGWEEIHAWNEGPNVIEYNGKYLMNYSANYFASNDYAICMAVADDPMGPWIKPDYNPVLTAREGLFGAGHNAFFRTKEGKLYTSFHVQTNPDNPSGDRRVVIGEVLLSVDKDGNIHEDIV